MKKRFALALAVLACGLPWTASAGVIRGTVHVPNRGVETVPAMNPYPGRAGSMPGSHGCPRGLATDAVVYVDHVPSGAETALAHAAAAAVRPRLAQKDQSFVPRVLAIAAGMAVDFPNQDPIYHNVFSLSPPRRFDLGKYPRGSSKQVVFPKPGVINVYCDIHTDMAAFILVLPHHGYARPSSTGAFALPNLPAGHYQLRAWHPDLGEQTTSVDVPEVGEVAVDLSF